MFRLKQPGRTRSAGKSFSYYGTNQAANLAKPSASVDRSGQGRSKQEKFLKGEGRGKKPDNPLNLNRTQRGVTFNKNGRSQRRENAECYALTRTDTNSGVQWEFCIDFTASSAVNLPITRASLRFVVVWIGIRSTRNTYWGACAPPRFTFTTNLMFFMIPSRSCDRVWDPKLQPVSCDLS